MDDESETAGPSSASWGFLAPAEGPDEIGRLGPYRVIRLLGRGGMGMVYQAEDIHLRRPVALKVMLPDLAEYGDAKARFLREARAAAALSHDQIVTIYQVGEDRGVPYLAMEFLRGRSLDDWLRPDRRAGVAETIGIGKQVARGLAAAHNAGLIHRDIKPANLWLQSPQGRVKILDFGLARRVEGEFTALTQSGALLGTPAYMAPEQARGESVDGRCDLFSLGCVLYRMVTGRLPFQGPTVYAVLAALASEEPTPPRVLNPEVPPRLESLILRLLAKRADDRTPSAKAVLDELSEIQREIKAESTPGLPFPAVETMAPGAADTLVDPDLATQAEAPGDPADAGPPATPDDPKTRRRRPWPALAAVVGVAAGLAGLVMALNRPRGEAEPTPVPNRIDSADLVGPEAGSPATPGGEPSKVADPVDLTAMFDTTRDALKGMVGRLKTGAVKAKPAGETGFSLALPWDPPPTFRLKFAVTRMNDGNDAPLFVGLASGPGRFNLMIDGEVDGGIGTVLRSAKTRDRDGGGTTVRRGSLLPRGVRMEAACLVEPDRVSLSLNGKQVYAWRGDPTTLQRPRGLVPLMISGGRRAVFHIEDIVLEPLGPDRGKPLELRDASDSP